jgi:hypothetical protein
MLHSSRGTRDTAFKAYPQPRLIFREFAVSGAGSPSSNPRMTNLSDLVGGGLVPKGAIPASV